MSVLEENPADPFRERKQKHVIAERGRPIGHRQSNSFACDHTATADQEDRRRRREPGEAI